MTKISDVLNSASAENVNSYVVTTLGIGYRGLITRLAIDTGINSENSLYTGGVVPTSDTYP